MSSGITRISDLPDLPENFIGSSQPLNDQTMQNTYAPINAHPNPYGNNQGGAPPLPQPSYTSMSVPMPNNLTPEQQSSLQNIPQQRLPSRDIKINKFSYTQDEEIQPNYIPKKKKVKFDEDLDDYVEDDEDYIEKQEKLSKKKIEKHKQESHRAKLIDFILTEIQIPVFVSLLFLIFQMNFVKILMIKYLNFIPLYNSDGNLNFNGILLKSVIFGILFYIICKFTNYISEI
jgi:hypothetical protein